MPSVLSLDARVENDGINAPARVRQRASIHHNRTAAAKAAQTMKHTTLQMHRLMDLASRPGGVLCRDVAASLDTPKKSGDITKNARRLQIAGWMTSFEMSREGKTMLARCATTPELFAQWVSEHQVNTKANKKRVSGPAMTVIRANYGHAWWDKTAQPGDEGYVEPVITSETKVTICPGFSEHPRWSNTHLQF